MMDQDDMNLELLEIYDRIIGKMCFANGYIEVGMKLEHFTADEINLTRRAFGIRYIGEKA